MFYRSKLRVLCVSIVPFVLKSMPEPSILPPVFQTWSFAPAQVNDELSFEVAAGPGEPTAVWSLDLPADPEQAQAQLAQMEAQIRAAQAALAIAPERLDTFVQRMESGQEAEFALEAYPGDGETQNAEAELLEWLEAVQPGEVSFEAAVSREGELEETVSQFRQALDVLTGQILHLAKVETRQDGELIAHSLVSWKGDLDTSWRERISPEEQGLHQRSLKLALISRLAMLKMIVTATQGAVKIAALIATPGGALLALPAAWKYLNALLSQAKNI